MDAKKRFIGLMLVLIMVAAVGVQLLILLADDVPPIYDQLGLTRASLVLGKGLASSDANLVDAFFGLTAGSAFPPLIHYTALTTTLFFHGTLLAPVASFWLFIAIIILSCYSVARHAAGRTAGLLAAAIVMLMPGLDGFSRIYMVDFPLTAMVAAACALLFATRRFTLTRHSLLLGVVLGLGLLAKQSFPIYITPPIVVYATAALVRKERADDRKVQIANLVMMAALSLVIASVWYAPRIQAIIVDRLAIDEFYRQLEPEKLDTFAYLHMLAYSGTGIPLFAATLLGAWAAGVNRQTAAVLSGIVVPLLALPAIFTMSTPRYLLPVLPYCAVTAAAGIVRLFGKRSPYAAAVLILVSAIGLYRHNDSYPAGPLNWRQMHERFQEVGLARPQFIDRETVDETVASIDRWRTKGRIVMLLDSPMTQSIEAFLWQKNLLLPIENVFEMASVGRIPKGLTEKEDLTAYLKESQIIVLAAGAPNGLDTYAPNGNLPAFYADRVFAALDEVRSSFGQVFQKKSMEGPTIRVLMRLEKP